MIKRQTGHSVWRRCSGGGSTNSQANPPIFLSGWGCSKLAGCCWLSRNEAIASYLNRYTAKMGVSVLIIHVHYRKQPMSSSHEYWFETSSCNKDLFQQHLKSEHINTYRAVPQVTAVTWVICVSVYVCICTSDRQNLHQAFKAHKYQNIPGFHMISANCLSVLLWLSLHKV